MLAKEIFEKIKEFTITENQILSLFFEYETLSINDINEKILKQIFDLIEVEDEIDIFYTHLISNKLFPQINERLKNLVNKKYLTQTLSKEIGYFYTIKNSIALCSNSKDKETIIRANIDKTLVFYNNIDKTKIIKLDVKTKVELNKDSFIGCEILSIYRDDNDFNKYIIIFIAKPYSCFYAITNKNDKSLNNIKPDTFFRRLYKYYSMKISFKYLYPIELVRGKSEDYQISLTITNKGNGIANFIFFKNKPELKNIIGDNILLYPSEIIDIDNLQIKSNDCLFVCFFQDEKCCHIKYK